MAFGRHCVCLFVETGEGERENMLFLVFFVFIFVLFND